MVKHDDAGYGIADFYHQGDNAPSISSVFCPEHIGHGVMNNFSTKSSGKNVIRLPQIFIPIALFIIFDIVALGLNFWISAKLEISAVAINLSGRQRMLSQRMTKSLLMLQTTNEDKEKSVIFDEFSKAVDLFDKTLYGFAKGGITLSGDGNSLFLPQVTDTESRFITAQATQVWEIVYQILQPFIKAGLPADHAGLQAAMESLAHHNLQLLKLMNDLTTALEMNATHEVFQLRILQGGMLLIALLNFVLVCKRLVKQIHLSHNNILALRNVIDSIETGIVICDGDEIVRSANRAANLIFGAYDNELIGRRLPQLIFKDSNRTLGIRKDNSTFQARINMQTLYEFDHKVSLCTIIDASEQVIREKQLMEMAFFDPLTGLPNRSLLMERLDQELLRAKRESTLLAVMFLDLDGFKPVNDQLGHDAGDELLKLVGKRFQQSCREIDTVARLGGDEFVFILNSLHSLTVANQIANTILMATSQAFLVKDQTVKVGASIGIAVYPEDHTEANLLLKYADDAMYLAKQRGKNRYVFASELKELQNNS